MHCGSNISGVHIRVHSLHHVGHHLSIALDGCIMEGSPTILKKKTVWWFTQCNMTAQQKSCLRIIYTLMRTLVEIIRVMKSCLYKTLRGCHILVTYRVHFLRVCSELVHQELQCNVYIARYVIQHILCQWERVISDRHTCVCMAKLPCLEMRVRAVCVVGLQIMWSKLTDADIVCSEVG